MVTCKDYTSFYAHNESVAEEIRRLLRTGALDQLVGLLRSSGVRLEFESFSPALKQAEYLGQLEPGEAEGDELYEYEDFMADRVEQDLEFPDGVRRHIHMPDHVCPTCGHDQDNYIVETAKTCAACSFQW